MSTLAVRKIGGPFARYRLGWKVPCADWHYVFWWGSVITDDGLRRIIGDLEREHGPIAVEYEDPAHPFVDRLSFDAPTPETEEGRE